MKSFSVLRAAKVRRMTEAWAVFIVLLAPLPIWSQSSDEHWGLEGKPTVEVVAFSSWYNTPPGVSKKQLRDEVELILRQSRIPMYMQWSSDMGTPRSPTPAECELKKERDENCGWLIVDIRTQKVSDVVYSYAVNASFRQWMGPLRPTAVWIQFAETWHDSSNGVVTTQRIAEIVDAVREVVRHFALEYLKANPN